MTTDVPARATTGAVRDIELTIGGMTCASCANRIERKLNKLDGVTATVNYATEKARVSAPNGVEPAALVWRGSKPPATPPSFPGCRRLPAGRPRACRSRRSRTRRGRYATASAPAWCSRCPSSRWR